MSRKALIGFVLSSCAAVPAVAEKPYYFHKAGVSRETYMADVDRCLGLVTGVKVEHYTVQPNYNAPHWVESAAIASFFVGFLECPTLSQPKDRGDKNRDKN